MNKIGILNMAILCIIMILPGCGGNKDVKPSLKQEPLKQIPSEQLEKPDIKIPEQDLSLSPAYGDTIIESSRQDAVIINPVLYPDTPSGIIIGLVFNGLLKTDANLEFAPDLAESWEILDKGLTFKFVLKKGVKWHDGMEFTAADVVYTFEKILEPETQIYNREDYTLVSTIEVHDQYNLSIKYDKPFAPALSTWTLGIVPKHIFENEPDFNKSKYNQAPIGTGPFKLLEWIPDEKIVLEANEEYFDGRPYVDMYVFNVLPDSSMAFLALRKENADMMGLTPDQYEKQANTREFLSKFNIYKYSDMGYTYAAFNLTKPMFQDVRLRRALAMATDRKSIIDNILYGNGKVISGPYSHGMWAYNHDVKPYPYDTEAAGKLLEEAGWIDADGDGIREKNGKKLEIKFSTDNGKETRKLIARYLQDQWKKVGVKVSLDFVEWGAFMDVLDYQTFDVAMLGWGLAAEPDHYGAWHSSQHPDMEKGKVGDNFVSYANKEVDRLIEEGRTTFDMEKRKKIYNQIHKLIHDDVPYIFLFEQETLKAVHNRIHGVKVAPSGIRYNFEKWYVPEKLQRY